MDIKTKEFQFKTIQFQLKNKIATINLNNPPVNALSGKMMQELRILLDDIATDQNIKVIIFESANPDFFLAHVDMHILEEKEIFEQLSASTPEGLNIFQTLGEIIRQQPQVTIVKLKGIARGGGAEFVAAADMSFASKEKGKLAQCEALMGIIPGGGATHYLPSKMSRNRALEIILGADLMDAETADRYGWINRAIADDEIDLFVENLAENIAALADGIIEATKKSLPLPVDRSPFILENEQWQKTISQPAAGNIMAKALENGAQTIAGELNLEALLREI